jgi:hemoglobin/transferrin/lactoferrin receptor protein
VQGEGDRWSASLSGSYTVASGLIVGVPASLGAWDLIAANSGDAEIWGIEIEGKWRLGDGWWLRGQGSWDEGNVETEQYLGGHTTRESLSRMIPPTAMLALRWESGDGRFWGEGRVSGAALADRLAAADKNDGQRIPSHGTPGYVVFGLGGGWQVTDRLDIRVDVDNLSNESYRIHGSGQNQPGLGALVGVRYHW